MKPLVINKVVEKDLCIGCGLCISVCPTNTLKIDWNKEGFLVAKDKGQCTDNGNCIKVCPFNPNPELNLRTEIELSANFNKNYKYSNKYIGKYVNLYAGYSEKYRKTSSSGGIAMWCLTELLISKQVDYVVSVGESESSRGCFDYLITNNVDELFKTSKTKYYPVSLDKVIEKIDDIEGRIAIVSIPCFLKAIRLKQYYNDNFSKKIVFTIGIFCGGMKSRFFTEYLSDKCQSNDDNIKPYYRIKDFKSTANDYSFGVALENDKMRYIKMKDVGDMWGTGLFKANACDFCDDISGELADISVGDAWVEPYVNDGMGTNLIIARTEAGDKLLNRGIKQCNLQIHKIDLKTIIESQKGNIRHRQIGLQFRLLISKLKNQIIPPKRYKPKLLQNPFFINVLYYRRIVREKSIKTWKEKKNAQAFDKNMASYLKKLKIFTLIYHLSQIRYFKAYFKKLTK